MVKHKTPIFSKTYLKAVYKFKLSAEFSVPFYNIP
jgi:hypothetical protein